MTVKPTKVEAFLKTDVGMVRDHNEDSAFADERGLFFIVADGMGGHAAGEVASAMAVDEVRAALEQERASLESLSGSLSDDKRRDLMRMLENAVQRAHQAVFTRGAREPDKKGMGTTLEVVILAGGEAFIAHVGDSRTYLVRNDTAAQVTTDHTVAEVLVLEGKLTAEEARISPMRTILVNAIGVSPDVGVELTHVRLRRGDKLLLCSDGMHDYYPMASEVAELVAKAGDGGLIDLVEIAKERGGHDNITGILVHVVEGNPTVEEEEEEARRMASELSQSQAPGDREAVPMESLATQETMPLDSGDPASAPTIPKASAPDLLGDKPKS
jgi:serine/threonine protein phosphatase PrpC